MKIGRVLSVWLIIVITETFHGIARELLLVELVDDFMARQIGVFTGSLLILLITTLTITWLDAKTKTQQFTIGLIWTLLIFVFEVTLGLFLNYTFERIFSDYDLSQGGLMGLGLLVMLFAPYFGAKMRGVGT